MTPQLIAAYKVCLQLAQTHYENFPVVSWFLPHRQKISLAAVYAFARTADDFADSATFPPAVKLAALKFYQAKLNLIAELKLTTTDQKASELLAPKLLAAKQHSDPLDSQIIDSSLIASVVQELALEDRRLLAKALLAAPYQQIFSALRDTINHYQLPIQLFHQLLQAFMQDAAQTRYHDFAAVLKYCELSADPVGKLVLHIFGADTPANINYANAICTGLQLINFMQDCYDDLIILDRCYLPVSEMQKHNVNIGQLKAKINSPGLDRLIAWQLNRISAIYHQGLPLIANLTDSPWWFRFYVKLIIAGGALVLAKLFKRANHFARPTLTMADKLCLLCNSLVNNNLLKILPVENIN